MYFDQRGGSASDIGCQDGLLFGLDVAQPFVATSRRIRNGMPGTKESRLGTNCWKWESLSCGIFNGAKGEQNTNRNDVVMLKLLMHVGTI